MVNLRVPYNKNLKEYAKLNRNNPTYAEQKLWKYLKHNQQGVNFNRQKPLLNYIVDFYNIPLRLAIEIDGSSHGESKFQYDEKRQKDLEKKGITFLRFTEYEVMNSIDNVLTSIEVKLQELLAANTPNPS